jgi:mannose-6-phosphate isomerase-like protein (cupin superfamily)
MSERPGYEILSLTEVERYPDPRHDGPVLLPLRYLLDLRAFGANAWTGPVGKQAVPRHQEDSGDDELYVVVKGRATFTVDDETLDAGEGTLVYVPNGVVREAVAEEPETIVLAVGATRGQAYAARGWDEVVVAFAKARAGDVGGGRAVLDTLLARQPEEWPGPYNAACFEALHGDADHAFAALRKALELDEEAVRGYAPRDDDLAGLHDDPRWQELFA